MVQENRAHKIESQKKEIQVDKEQDNKDKESLAEEIKEKLDWYIVHTSEEDYDDEVVDSFLKLLDRLEPLDKQAPKAEDALMRFQEMAEQRELRDAGGEAVLAIDAGAEAVKAEKGKPGRSGGMRYGTRVLAPGRSKGKAGIFLVRHKYIAAVILLALIIGVLGTTQAIASPDSGFFHWLKRDETGTEMVTSPENLDGAKGAREKVYYNNDDVPDWARGWLEIEEAFEMLDGYKWERYEVNRFDNMQSIISVYSDGSGEDILLGMIDYVDIISYNRENFLDYNYVGDYETGEKHMEIYSKSEESGKIYYTVCFEESNKQYFVQGRDNIEDLKSMAMSYYNCVKNNL